MVLSNIHLRQLKAGMTTDPPTQWVENLVTGPLWHLFMLEQWPKLHCCRISAWHCTMPTRTVLWDQSHSHRIWPLPLYLPIMPHHATPLSVLTAHHTTWKSHLSKVISTCTHVFVCRDPYASHCNHLTMDNLRFSSNCQVLLSYWTAKEQQIYHPTWPSQASTPWLTTGVPHAWTLNSTLPTPQKSLSMPSVRTLSSLPWPICTMTMLAPGEGRVLGEYCGVPFYMIIHEYNHACTGLSSPRIVHAV